MLFERWVLNCMFGILYSNNYFHLFLIQFILPCSHQQNIKMNVYSGWRLRYRLLGLKYKGKMLFSDFSLNKFCIHWRSPVLRLVEHPMLISAPHVAAWNGFRFNCVDVTKTTFNFSVRTLAKKKKMQGFPRIRILSASDFSQNVKVPINTKPALGTESRSWNL